MALPYKPSNHCQGVLDGGAHGSGDGEHKRKLSVQVATRQALSLQLVHEGATLDYSDFSEVTQVHVLDFALRRGNGGLVPSIMVGLLAAIATDVRSAYRRSGLILWIKRLPGKKSASCAH